MQQLALFDIASAVVPSLKPGDWVKLRRKSTSAAYWKKGEVVQVESVHPINGGARFWNDRAECWGYLHPGDVIPVPPPLDSVSKPIAPDTESTAPPADTESTAPTVEFDSVSKPIAPDAESTAPPADTESIPEPVEFDSVSVQPIALDTESTAPPADTESIPEPVEFDSVSVQPIALDTESTAPPADTESIPEPVEFDSVSVQPIALDTESTAPPADTESNFPHSEFDSVSGPVSFYRPKGTARGGEYFRFSYRAGKKMKHLHIPGGNTSSILAQSRAAEVMELVAAGVPSLEICDRIRSWSGKNIT
jgi:hypothetical protein